MLRSDDGQRPPRHDAPGRSAVPVTYETLLDPVGPAEPALKSQADTNSADSRPDCPAGAGTRARR